MRSLLAAPFQRLALASLALAGALGTGVRAQTGPPSSLHYPVAARGAQSDDLNGIRVADPYRWLENPTAAEVRSWVSAENTLTDWFLSQNSKRAEVRERVTRAWDYPKISAPFSAGDRLFFYENSGLENQPALYVQERDGMPRVLLDPNMFTKDGLIAIVDQSPSPDGRYLAYAVSTQGSSWRTVRVRDVRTAQDLSDELTGIKSGPLAWTRDERGFFYTKIDPGHAPSPNPLAADGRQRIYYHRVGRSQKDDQLVYENDANPTLDLTADVSDDGQYLVITLRSGSELANRLYFIDLDNPKRPNLGAPLVKLFDNPDALYEFVASHGNIFFIRTTKGAPHARLVGVDINTPDPNYWTTIIRETFDALIGVHHIDDRFIAHRLHEVHSVLELYALDGASRGAVQLPSVGTVTEINTRPESRDVYFTFTSFVQPPTTYRFDLDTRNVMTYKEARADTALARYETTQLYYTSKEGTRVPMFITAKRGITLDGSHMALLVAEGGFNVSMTPVFSPEVAAWLELGGIYAVANVRGGGEYGRGWHTAALGAKKPVAIDDLLSAADFLVNQRYTRVGLLGVSGRGHGATLVAAAMERRPDAFGAVLLDAGVFDLSRYTRFTIGESWIPEYGSPDRPSELKGLLTFSPLQRIEERAYPATFITVGERDEVVTPAHSYKFAAALQAAQRGSAPILLRADSDVGFGPGTPTSKLIALSSDRLTFLLNALRR